ncbi:MAG: 4Fe-4S dicluster domain-containing protein [bacterium]|nr:MAG: 4Fe-4S dicluster domain-containing protein [bacterium]
MAIQGIILLVIFVAVLAAFGYIVRLLYRLLRKGVDEDRFGQWAQRVNSVVVFVGAQARVLAQPAGIGHFLIFWGFIFITLGTIEHILGMIFPGFGFEQIFGTKATGALSWLQDVFGILVIGSIIVALFRRFILKPERLKIDDPKARREATLILGLIFVLILLMYGFRGTAILMDPGEVSRAAAPLSHYAARLMSGWGMNLPIANGIFAWIHHLIIFFFLIYIPFSKHIHILGAIPNVFFRNLGPMGTLSRMDFEDESAEKFGISEIQEFTWKQLLDLYACTECGRCQVACPAYLTEKPLSPFRVIHNLRGHLMDERKRLLSAGGDGDASPQIIPETVTEDELWACTTCGACMQECPPFIEHVQKIVDLRRFLVLTESRFPSEMQPVFKNMEVNYNPWALGYASRADWVGDMPVPLAAEKKSFDVLYWVGCAGSFDARGQDVSRAVVGLLQRAGVDFAILGTEEMCCGETARRMGNEYLAQTLIESNIETFKKYEFKMLVTACPHGLNSFRVEYPQFGYEIPVLHHSEFLLDLIRSGKLRADGIEKARGAYHDSCYLGRYNGIASQPRDILRHIPRLGLAEFPRREKRSFCCGAGGGRMWMEETLGTRINEARVEEFLGLGADHIFVACPFCMTMFEDGLKAKEREDIKVLDIAEILLAACKTNTDSP